MGCSYCRGTVGLAARVCAGTRPLPAVVEAAADLSWRRPGNLLWGELNAVSHTLRRVLTSGMRPGALGSLVVLANRVENVDRLHRVRAGDCAMFDPTRNAPHAASRDVMRFPGDHES